MLRLRAMGFAALLGTVTTAGLFSGGCNTDDSGGTGEPANDGGPSSVDATQSGHDANTDAASDHSLPSDVARDASSDANADAGRDDADASPGVDADAGAASDADATTSIDADASAASDADATTSIDADAASDDGAVPVDLDAEDGDVETDADAGDGAPPESPTVTAVRALLGDGCVEAGETIGCFQAMTGVLCEEASGTTDAGTRESLCFSTLQCIFGTGLCGLDESVSVVACYCGAVPAQDCAGTPATGVCAAQEQIGLETSNPSSIERNFSDPTTGAGIANALSQCLASVPECFSLLTLPASP